MLLLPPARVLKPTTGAQVDRASRLAHRLEHLYAFTDPAGTILRDLAGIHALTYGANTVSNWHVGLPGLALTFLSQGNVGATAIIPTIAPPFTLACVFRRNAGQQDGFLISHDAGADGGYRMRTFPGSGDFGLTFGAVANYSSLSTVDDIWYVGVITVTGNGGTGTSYLQPFAGGAITSVSDTVGTISGTPTGLGVGSRTDHGSGNFGGEIAFVAHWSRALQAQEVLTLLRDPYVLVAPSRRRLWIDGPAAAAGAGFPHHYYAQQRVA